MFAVPKVVFSMACYANGKYLRTAKRKEIVISLCFTVAALPGQPHRFRFLFVNLLEKPASDGQETSGTVLQRIFEVKQQVTVVGILGYDHERGSYRLRCHLIANLILSWTLAWTKFTEAQRSQQEILSRFSGTSAVSSTATVMVWILGVFGALKLTWPKQIFWFNHNLLNGVTSGEIPVHDHNPR